MPDGQEDEMQTSKRSRIGRRLNILNLGSAALTASRFLGGDPAVVAAHLAGLWHIIPRVPRLHRSTPSAQVPRGLFFSTLCCTFQQGHLRGRRRDQTPCSLHQNWLRWLGTGRLGGGRLRRRTVAISIFHHQHPHPTIAPADVMCTSPFFFQCMRRATRQRVRIAGRCDVRRWRRPLPTPLCLGRRWVRTPWGSLAALAALSNGQAVPGNGQTAATS